MRGKRMEWQGERTVGLWTVLGFPIETSGGERKWLCRCACGTERYVLERSLRYGTSLSCGCTREARRLAAITYDLEGKSFGDLTVLRRAENVPKDSRRGIRWLCLCSCGRECVVLASLLVSGKKTHCGCKNKTYKNIAGRKYHFLTALYPLKERSEKGEVIWRCRCDCGNEINVTYNELVYSNLRSCGCKKKAHALRMQEFLTRADQTSIDRLRSKNLSSANSSGVKGVYFHKGKWIAKIVFQYKQYHLGRFATKEEAIEARLEGERLLFDGVVAHYDRWRARAVKDPRWAEENPFRVMVNRARPKHWDIVFFPKTD